MVYMDPNLGGNGETYTADANPETGMKQGGHRSRWEPAFASAVNMIAFTKSQAELALLYKNQAIDIASSVADVDTVVSFYNTYAAAAADVGNLSEGDVVEVIADENYDDQRARYLVQSSALVFQFVVNEFDSSDFPALQQNRSMQYWMRKALVDSGAIPEVSPSLIYDFSDRPKSRKAGDDVSLDTDITFSRSSVASGFGANGLVNDFASGDPRYVYDPDTGESVGLLFEGQSTNLVTYSEELDNVASWGANEAVVTANAALSPRGDSTAEHIAESSNNGLHYARQQQSSLGDGVSRTVSAYVKKAERDYAIVGITDRTNVAALVIADLVNGVVTDTLELNSTIESFDITKGGNGFWRVSLRFSSSTFDSSTWVSVGPYNQPTFGSQSTTSDSAYVGDGASGIYAWGVQLETTSMSSYIKTEASTATRIIDKARVDDISGWYNPDGTTFVVEFMPFFNGGLNDSTVLGLIKTGETVHQGLVEIDNRGFLQTAAATHGTPGTYESGDRIRVAVAVDSNQSRSCVNGGVLKTGSPLGYFDAEVMGIGARMRSLVTSDAEYRGSIKFIKAFPVSVSDADLEALSAL